MTKTQFQTIDAYIGAQPKATQAILRRVRTTIRKAVPAARQTISYNIPAFTLPGGTVIYFAGWKQHYSLYPANDRLVAAFKKQLEPYEVNGKGTIRFPLSEPVPVKLIEGIAKFRAKEVLAKSKATLARGATRAGKRHSPTRAPR